MGFLLRRVNARKRSSACSVNARKRILGIRALLKTVLCKRCLKATFPPNISIEKFCQSAKRIIGVSSAAVVRDVFATTASFKRCTVLHNAFPVCTTVYVFQANSMCTLALAPSRPLQNCRLITLYPRGCWIQEGTRYTPRRTTTVESENGLRKICFVQKIDRESRREGLLFCAR